MSHTRREFTYTLPIREIRPEDGIQPFKNDFHPLNTRILERLIQDNMGNRHILVYDLDGKVLGFLVFLEIGDHLHIDLVERNFLHDVSNIVKPGPALVVFVESASRDAGFYKTTLCSTQENVRLYEGLGYHRSGTDFEDPNYGTLTPMEKILS